MIYLRWKKLPAQSHFQHFGQAFIKYVIITLSLNIAYIIKIDFSLLLLRKFIAP